MKSTHATMSFSYPESQLKRMHVQRQHACQILHGKHQASSVHVCHDGNHDHLIDQSKLFGAEKGVMEHCTRSACAETLES